MKLDWPLMQDNITREDVSELIQFLGNGQYYGSIRDLEREVPRLTNGSQVAAFERDFAKWLGVEYAVMVNSGASANLLTMQALKILQGPGRVLVPCITWVSDIAAVIHAGLEPVFVDIHPETLGMDMLGAARHSALAVFVTHCLGFPAVKDWHADSVLIEDCCEALGAEANGRKLGTIGLMSNFSFYYAHHLSTIEGGMICTNDEHCYELVRMLRSHGLVREIRNETYRRALTVTNPDLDPEFIFAHLGYNMRPTEINGVLGRAQLPRLDFQNAKRTANLVAFLGGLDPAIYRTTYRLEGSSNYALPLILKNPDAGQFSKVTETLAGLNVECRKGTAGGGNQLRQPYAKKRWGEDYHMQFPEAEHVHQFGLYIGNFPSLERWKIDALCAALNTL